MFRPIILFLLLTLYFSTALGQTNNGALKTDSLNSIQLEEVIIVPQQFSTDKITKPLATIDEYLENANSVNMIRRGAYAWEPFLNGMGSERSVVTIDGMRIYAACTDKMDPVTSYVEITNLAKANVHSGQSGSTGGATIAGTLDLVRKKEYFGKKEFKSTVFSGYETNNKQKIIGTAISYSQPKLFMDIDFTYRDAENYKAGKGEKILYSQFKKYNMSAIAGYKINEHQHIEASLIYDRAVDVGYPALPMDVSLAKAIIASGEYVRHHISPIIQQWKTKIYYNDITHRMDDTKRPIVPIRMDMPGWSTTAGFYSSLEGKLGEHSWKANLSGHHNKSLAEMTMFSNNPQEKDMFMLTWPGVHTNYADIFIEDLYPISEKWKASITAGLAIHNNQVNNKFGLESLQIFYPHMQKSTNRLLKRASVTFQYGEKRLQYAIGLGYGERAPNVSEGYGFYLFNSFDRFDYIGNPDLKNEKSIDFNTNISYNTARLSAKLSGAFFYINDYIIGKPTSGLSPMTIGALGVKTYEQLKYAQIFNASLDFNYKLNKNWQWLNKLAYRRGIGHEIKNLPMIQPFTFLSSVSYIGQSFSAEATASGAGKLNNFNTEFGESAVEDYIVFNLSASKRFKLAESFLTIKSGVENLLDKKYTTFADWNRLPRMGRNVFVNIVWNFKKKTPES